MTFIKTRTNDDFRFYFEDDQGQQCSPSFLNTTSAKLWRDQQVDQTYRGFERRHPHTERRRILPHRLLSDDSRSKPEGRRRCDKPLNIDRDLSYDAMQNAYQRYSDFYI